MLSDSALQIVDDGGGIGQALVDELARRGVDSTLVDTADGEAPQVIDLQGLAAVSSIDDALAIQRRAFLGAQKLADSAEFFAVAFDTGGGFGLDPDLAPEPQRAWLGGLSALAKTAALEWPKATVRAIDISIENDRPEGVAQRIADELTCGGPEIEIALSPGGARRTVVSRPIPWSDTDDARTITTEDVVLASGGARGVTAHCLIELARQARPAIILLGRTALEREPPFLAGATTDTEIKRALIEDARARGETPDLKQIGRLAAKVLKQREVAHTLAAIEAAGSAVHYVAADVRDRDALRAGLEEVAQITGPPTMLVHAAGVLADKRIKDKTTEQFDFVFDTKVDGLRALLEITEDAPLKRVCLFSSVAARTGNVGQVDYAMANETLNKVAHALASSRGIGATSLNWGPWDGGMVDESLRAHFQSRGVSLIDLDGGARAFCDLFDQPHIELVLGDGLLGEQTPASADVSFDRQAFPGLEGHAIDGVVVVPATYVLELFADFARANSPGRELLEITNFDVVRGIQLPRYAEDDTPQFAIVSQAQASAGSDELRLELRGPDDVLHYRATAILGDQKPQPPAPVEGLKTSAVEAGAVHALYEPYLFHRGDFRVIRTVQNLGGPVACAKLEPASRAIALDAGLQLALAQTTAADDEGRPNLPTSLGSFCDLGLPERIADLTITCRRVERTNLRALYDIDYHTDAGDHVAALRSVVMHYFSPSDS